MKNKTALISLPWHPFDYFSLQIGSLTAAIRSAQLDVTAYHYYKDFIHFIPGDIYSELHRKSLGEAVFAALLYPKRFHIIETELHKKIAHLNLSQVVKGCENYLLSIMQQQNWNDFDIIGFTISHEQLMASLCLAQRLKNKYPKTSIVFGGALLSEITGRGLLLTHPFIDVAVYGEGEQTLLQLVQNNTEEKHSKYDDIKGIVFRQNKKIIVNPPQKLIRNMDELPYPDFSDYFLNDLVQGSSDVLLNIPFETSRGCCWGKCVFCNLALQWDNKLRHKSPKRVVDEVRLQVHKYESNKILFTDTNISASHESIRKIAKLNLNLRIFAEVSAHISYENFVALHKSGLRSIQVGIESFSDYVLKKYNKGTTVMKNLEMLKWCSMLGIDVGYNIIINYPGERPQDAIVTLDTMQYAKNYSAPSIIDYSLSFNSDAFKNMRRHNISSYKIPSYYRAIYPKSMLAECFPLLTLWIKPIPIKKKSINWQPVKDFVAKWSNEQELARGKPMLIWRDSGKFLVVETNRSGINDSWILKGLQRDIYLLCDKESAPIEKISQETGASKTRINKAIADLSNHKVLFYHNGRVLSLAVQQC
ncbi:MAG: RiPP maturation radical SAM C-methyltransferase [Deltaproteobacteria bacterium]|nr:RiPP maturation radical SAM C-methyltransferase [Deltaproteobacteria bacterium]